MALRNRQSVVLLPMPVWDVSVRVFHWLLVLLLPLSYVTIKGGWPQVHLILGYVTLALVMFRILWGFVGSDTARFARFLQSPAAALRHLRQLTVRQPDTQAGHNPAGGWMVAVMLLLLALQAISGLFARHRETVEGPLAKYLDGTTVDAVSLFHAANFKVIFVAAVLHVGVVAIYLLLKGQNLIRPMLTGKKRLPAATRAPRLRGLGFALPLLLLCAAIAAALATQF